MAYVNDFILFLSSVTQLIHVASWSLLESISLLVEDIRAIWFIIGNGIAVIAVKVGH